jgi:hypothetical protein
MLSLTPLLLQHVWGRSNRYLFWDGGIALSMSLEVCIPALFCTLLSKGLVRILRIISQMYSGCSLRRATMLDRALQRPLDAEACLSHGTARTERLPSTPGS